jgi:HAD superfamily hydrolase (TIGR01509 family)
MKIKLIVFDLDGVLIDSRPLHYHALNMALEEINPKYIITENEHLSRYDGNPTTVKLNMLTKEKGLSPDLHHKIWKMKQDKTQILINKMTYNERLRNILAELKNDGYLLYCASNSIWNTIKMMLLRNGLLEYFDFFISNEDIKYAKPNPEIYLRCLQRANVSSFECLVLEDSPIGRKAAQMSRCHLCPIENPEDVTLEKIYKYIKISENKTMELDTKWKKPINVIIPMAGRGSRFTKAGYVFPKPLIEVKGKPMIQVVVENLNIDGKFIFLVQKEHMEKYQLKALLNLIAPNCEIIILDGITEGAACTVLKAKEFINNDTPLLTANSDQFLEWNSNEFLYCMESEGVDGGISTFEASHPKWSYAKLGEDGYVSEVAEKKPISKHATTGIYYWKHGSDFVKYAEQMIEKNIRTNNEFYVCPVFNQAIEDSKKIKIKDCERMWGIGIPEDLQYFERNYKGNI